jgi:hypothetical protein
MRILRLRVVLAVGIATALAVSEMTLAGGAVNGGVDFRDFNPKKFSNSTSITNPWLPTLPGTQFVYEGQSLVGNKLVPHRIVSIVTDLTKVIDGVRVLVIWDRDYVNGVLAESELAFWAQDNAGNVWLLGEYPEEYSPRGRFQGAPSTWISGAAGSRAGVLMRANPRTGTSSYVQGYAPAVQFKDMARVYATGQRVCIPLRCYSNVLVVEEWNAFAPEEGHQLKYHAPGVGIVKIGSLDSTDQEVLTLTSVTRLGSKAMDAVRAQVMQLDQRGYQVQPAVYGTTSRAQPLGSSQALGASPESTTKSRAAARLTPPVSSPSAATLSSRKPAASPSTPRGPSAPAVRSRTDSSVATSPTTAVKSPASTSTTTRRAQTSMRPTSTPTTAP